MRDLLYSVLKRLIRAGFFCYFRQIRMDGMDQIPEDKPVMLLPNHQNALLDPLLYAAFARARKPYFLTRSDVFRNPVLKKVFEGIRMIPIYRIRDGRDSLQRNYEIFEYCADLFSRGEHILLFPEANHNLKRQVRVLSKGFTRILEHSLSKYPGLDIYIVPVGINYQQAAKFPDRAAFYFGKPFSVRMYWSEKDTVLDVSAIKQRVYEAIKLLTTHIPPDKDYDLWEQYLNQEGTNFLNPVSPEIFFKDQPVVKEESHSGESFRARAWDLIFRLLNAPMWLPWDQIVKKKVWEAEFMTTFRYLYSLIAYPIWLLLVFSLFLVFQGPWYAGMSVLVLFFHNLAYVKWR